MRQRGEKMRLVDFDNDGKNKKGKWVGKKKKMRRGEEERGREGEEGNR